VMREHLEVCTEDENITRFLLTQSQRRKVISDNTAKWVSGRAKFNTFKGRGVNWLHFAIQI